MDSPDYLNSKLRVFSPELFWDTSRSRPAPLTTNLHPTLMLVAGMWFLLPRFLGIHGLS
ncbi:hypothetical protein BJX65DRAFT_265026 [Aspergillus insuetus]